MAFAGTGLEQPPGQPPFGLKVQGAAKGTKLDGVISIEFYSCEATTVGTVCDARIFLRLRQGNTAQVQRFFGELTNVLASSPSAVQDAITDALATQVVDAFFPGQSLGLTLKDITNYVRLDVNTTTTPASIFVLADIVLAAN
jgi:hypothetical protein